MAEQPGFIYFECPACGFDSVYRATFPDGLSLCTLCIEDSGHVVRRKWRIAHDTDKPEGWDGRKEPRP